MIENNSKFKSLIVIIVVNKDVKKLSKFGNGNKNNPNEDSYNDSHSKDQKSSTVDKIIDNILNT